MEVRKVVQFTVWTTHACNLRCRYCYEGGEKQSASMSLATADDAVAFIIKTMEDHPEHNAWIVFHGGEPSLNFRVIEHVVEQIGRYLPGSRYYFSMTTNGTMLDDRKIEFLQRHLTEITVSLDGTQRTHDRERIDIRGEGSFQKAMETALRFNEEPSMLRIRMTVTPQNVAELFENIRFLIGCGFKCIVPGMDYFARNWSEESLEVLEQQLRLTKAYVKQQNDPELSVSMIGDEALQDAGRCTGAIDEFHICPDGCIYPCAYTAGDSAYRCGHVKTGIDAAKVQDLCAIYARDNPQCEGCTYYSGCISTRCKFLNEALTGDLFTPSPVVCLTQNVCVSVCRHC